uniref:Uncharacterized protein n=1 Tax=Arundo donax TaxID=35708 RepID=A0A0A9FVT0_ARUDO
MSTIMFLSPDQYISNKKSRDSVEILTC